MKTSSWWLALALSLTAAAPAPAHGDVLLYDVRGTVDSLDDPTNLFGTAGSGASFDLIYSADFSLGDRGGGGGSFGSSNYLTGGTIYVPDFPDSDFTVSPISATLTINGRKLDFSGDYFGRVFYTESFTFGFSRAELTAQSAPGPDGTALTQITARFDSSDPKTFGSVDVPGALLIDGQSITGSADFSYSTPGSDASPVVVGTLSPTTLSVTPAVPETSTAALMLLGLLVLSLILRRGPRRPL